MLRDVEFGPLAGSSVEKWIGDPRTILQMSDNADREFPRVVWNQYGYVPKNMIVVTAKCGDLAFYAKAQTWLLHPALADRIWGTDVDDFKLGQRLGEELWNVFGEELWNVFGEVLVKESQRQDEG